MPQDGYFPTSDIPDNHSRHPHLSKGFATSVVLALMLFAATAVAQAPRRKGIRAQAAHKNHRHRHHPRRHHHPTAAQSTNPPASGSSTPPPALSGSTAPPAAPTGDPAPLGVPGKWRLAFDDEFNGTSLNTSQWDSSWFNGGTMNNVATSSSNVSVGNGVLTLTLSNNGTGALIHTTQASGRATVAVGDVIEARIWFPGNGTTIYNWPAFWANDTNNYPAGGENDIAEGLGDLTVNYHSPSGTHNQGTVPGVWSAGWHTYALWRQVGHSGVYWDGHLVKSYSTDDNGAPEDIILNVGDGQGPTVTGPAGAVKVDYVRLWHP
jgi:hypothetical protein